MSFNKLVSRLLKRRSFVKHWWTPIPGNPNCYYILVNVGSPEDGYETKCVSTMNLNELLSTQGQQEVLNRLCWTMDLEN